MKTEIIKRPRVTEKAAIAAEVSNAYVFEVAKNATKNEIEKAVKALYKVSPIRVNVISLPAKKVISRGKRGKTAEVKKAVVYLKKGEKIELA